MSSILPIAIAPPSYSPIPVFADPSRDEHQARLLIVDDSRTVRTVFSTYLSKRFSCAQASSFNEAIAVLRSEEIDVVITDVIMPGLSGIELLRKIIAEYPNIAVIVVSGVERSQRAIDAMRLGAFDYIIKPCDPDVLEIAVDRAIKHRSLLLNALRSKVALETKNEELSDRKIQLEQLQSQMVQNAKMASLGQLAAGVAHELNNPVGFVHANLEMVDQYIKNLVRLTRFYENAEISAKNQAEAVAIKESIGYPMLVYDIDSILKDCRDGSDRIRDIVQNLKTFSRLDEAEYNSTDIHEGIDSTLRLISGYFSSGNVKLVREYGELPRIQAFSSQLNQVWMNLLVNAAQSIGPRKGELKIRTGADSDKVFVEISDSGCGIEVRDLDHIFDPFFTTKPIGEGTGLGLSISFGIVRRHGGQISVTSRLNEGTTFRVELPRHFESTIELNEKSIVAYSEA